MGEVLADSGRADNPEIPTAEEVIAALDRGESLDALIAPPAAGLEGGGGEGGGFVRVARINEPVESINYTFPENVFGRPDAVGETVAVPGGETAGTVVPPGQPPVEPPVEPPPPVTANPTLAVSVSVAAGYGYAGAKESYGQVWCMSSCWFRRRSGR